MIGEKINATGMTGLSMRRGQGVNEDDEGEETGGREKGTQAVLLSAPAPGRPCD